MYVCERGFGEVLWVLEKIVFGGAMLGGQIRRWNVAFCCEGRYDRGGLEVIAYLTSFLALGVGEFYLWHLMMVSGL